MFQLPSSKCAAWDNVCSNGSSGMSRLLSNLHKRLISASYRKSEGSALFLIHSVVGSTLDIFYLDAPVWPPHMIEMSEINRFFGTNCFTFSKKFD